MFTFVKSIWKDQTGATAIEYAFIVALVVIGIVSAVTSIGSRTSTTFNTIATKL
jgi:pilus assembly protein Flp/PilA